MSELDRLTRGIDRQIEEARQSGKFDNLPGKGKPLPKDEYLSAADDNRLAFKMLNDNNFLLPWMEKGQQIDRDLKAARESFHRTWDRFGGRESDPVAAQELLRSEAAFRQKIKEVNTLIRDYNLEIPNLRFERFILNAENEISRIKNQ